MGVKLQSSLGGSVEINAPSTASSYTLTAPAVSGTMAANSGASTDNAIVRFDGTGGAVQNSSAVIDDAGNMGLGVASATYSGSGVLGFNIANTGNGVLGNPANIWVANNVAFNSGFKYARSSAATLYNQSGGEHAWYTAPSGTAGNPITFTQAMTLDSAGRVTMPYQPCFKVYATTNFSLTTSFTVIPMAGVEWNISSAWSTSTNRFTAPVTGKYQFNFSFRMQSVTNYAYGYLRQNGLDKFYWHTEQTVGGYERKAYSTILSLNVGDYVDLTAAANSNVGYFDIVELSGFLIG